MLWCSMSTARRSSPRPSIERDWHGSVGAHSGKVSLSERWHEGRKVGSTKRYSPLEDGWVLKLVMAWG